MQQLKNIKKPLEIGCNFLNCNQKHIIVPLSFPSPPGFSGWFGFSSTRASEALWSGMGCSEGCWGGGATTQGLNTWVGELLCSWPRLLLYPVLSIPFFLWNSGWWNLMELGTKIYKGHRLPPDLGPPDFSPFTHSRLRQWSLIRSRSRRATPLQYSRWAEWIFSVDLMSFVGQKVVKKTPFQAFQAFSATGTQCFDWH